MVNVQKYAFTLLQRIEYDHPRQVVAGSIHPGARCKGVEGSISIVSIGSNDALRSKGP